jgi:hypothetical protein
MQVWGGMQLSLIDEQSAAAERNVLCNPWLFGW